MGTGPGHKSDGAILTPKDAMGGNLDAYDRLTEACAKMDYICFSLSFMNGMALLGAKEIDGLVYITRDIKEAMGNALKYSFCEKAQEGDA